MKHVKLFEDFVNESRDTVTFTIDDGNLDDKFLNNRSLSRNLDYKEDGGDTYYVLPKRDFDRFQDWADSSGFDIDEVIDIIEESVNESVSVSTMPYKSAHGKEPRGNGMWAFSVDGEDIFTPKAMNYGEALKWAKEEAKKRNASEIKVLG